MKLTDWLTRSRAALDKTPVNTAAGESTALLTQTAGAIFGLMPALMAKAASAAPTQHGSQDDGATQAVAGHAAAIGGTDLAHASRDGVGTSLGHAMPAASVHDGHGAAQAAPYAVQNEQVAGADHAHGSHGAIGSSAAPQPLHLPDTAHDVPHASSSAPNAASDPHAQPDAMHADMGQSMTQMNVLPGAMMDMVEGRAGLLHSGDARGGLDTSHGALHAVDGALAAIGDATHASLATLQSDVSQSVSHVAETVGQTVSTVDHVIGDATHLVSLGEAGDPASLAHGLGADLSQTTSSLEGAVPHALSAVEQVAGIGAHDDLPGGASGNAGSLAHGATSLLSTASHATLGAVGHDAADHANASVLPGSDPASLLHASVVAPHADAPVSSVGGLTHSLSDIGHAASQTSDGTPLHVPLIGQSYMDHDAGHDAGFSLHALHGI